jgi:hypothetical protein
MVIDVPYFVGKSIGPSFQEKGCNDCCRDKSRGSLEEVLISKGNDFVHLYLNGLIQDRSSINKSFDQNNEKERRFQSR